MNSKNSNWKKKIWSYDALLKAMQPTPEELEYRKEKSKEPDFLKKYSQSFKCTKCQVSFKQIIVKHEKVPTHPSLGVLMCENCCNYYEDGEFSLDSDGEDKYCRWCGEGGTIFSCSRCICGFCTACIKRHFPLSYFKQVQKDEQWLCFFCNPKPIWDQRFVYSLAKNLSESVDAIGSRAPSDKKEDEIDSNSDSLFELESNSSVKEMPKTQLRRSARKRESNNMEENVNESQVSLTESSSFSCISILGTRKKTKKQYHFYTSSSDESDEERSPKKVRFSKSPSKNSSEEKNKEEEKCDILSELKKIVVLSKHQMEFGVNWSNNTLAALENSDKTPEELSKECQKIKWFFSTMSSYLVQFSNSVDILEKSLPSNHREESSQSLAKNDQSGFKDILQFLGFVKNQVQIFMERGISLSDIFASEVYEDDKIIGIMKNSSSGTLKQYSSTKPHSKARNRKNARKNEGRETNDKDDESRSEDDVLVIDETHGRKRVVKDGEDSDSSCTTIGNQLTPSDPREDIRQILAILENA